MTLGVGRGGEGQVGDKRKKWEKKRFLISKSREWWEVKLKGESGVR